jgi:hypothetical protein
MSDKIFFGLLGTLVAFVSMAVMYSLVNNAFLTILNAALGN